MDLAYFKKHLIEMSITFPMSSGQSSCSVGLHYWDIKTYYAEKIFSIHLCSRSFESLKLSIFLFFSFETWFLCVALAVCRTGWPQM